MVRSRRIRFGEFEFDAQTLELFRIGHPVRIQRQPAMVLRLLLEQPGELVTREDLRRRIWGDERHVDVDRSVGYCLRHLRSVLADDARSPRFIETLRGRGYRFVGALDAGHEEPAAHAGAVPARTLMAHGPRRPRLRVAASAAAILVVAISLALLTIDPGTPPEPAATEPLASGLSQDVLLRRAHSYLHRDRVDDVRAALAVYQRVLDVAPDSARALAGVGAAESRLAFHRRDGREALDALSKSREALRRAPRDPDVLGAVAWSLLAAGRFGEAADAYRDAIVAAPDRPELIDELALLEYQRGRIDVAIELLTRRWQSTEPDPTPAGLIGTALTQLGFDAEAHGWQRLAADLAPDNLQAAYLEASLALRRGDLEEAHRLIAPVAAQPDPGALVVWVAAFVDAHRRGPTAALPALRAAVRDMPEAWNLRSVLADVYAAAGQHAESRRERDRAIEICRRGARDAPDSPFWPRCLASALAHDGDIEPAIAWYQRAYDVGWRRVSVDRADGWLQRLQGEPRFTAIEADMAADLNRMRERVIAAGIPVAPTVR